MFTVSATVSRHGMMYEFNASQATGEFRWHVGRSGGTSHIILLANGLWFKATAASSEEILS